MTNEAVRESIKTLRIFAKGALEWLDKSSDVLMKREDNSPAGYQMNAYQRIQFIQAELNKLEAALTAPTIPQAAEVPGFVPEGGKSLSAAVADSLRPYLSEGERVIWQEPFRWKDDNGVMPNHFESMSLDALAADFGYTVVHDCGCAGIIRAAAPTPTASAPKAEGEALEAPVGYAVERSALVKLRDDLDSLPLHVHKRAVVRTWIDAAIAQTEAAGRRAIEIADWYERDATQPPSEADRTCEGGDVVAKPQPKLYTGQQD